MEFHILAELNLPNSRGHSFEGLGELRLEFTSFWIKLKQRFVDLAHHDEVGAVGAHCRIETIQATAERYARHGCVSQSAWRCKQTHCEGEAKRRHRGACPVRVCL
jgi:hypothetical protein